MTLFAKFFSLISAFALAATFSACGSDNSSSASDGDQESSSSSEKVSSSESGSKSESGASQKISSASKTSSSESKSESVNSSSEQAKPICPEGKVCTHAPTAQLNSDIAYGEFLDDRDFQIYNTVTIGDQVWLAQNLNYKADGLTSFCYDDSDEKCDKYGRLYTWAAANGVGDEYNSKLAFDSSDPGNSAIEIPNQGLCPKGFHIPSREEWEKLRDYIASKNKDLAESEYVGVSLKSKTWNASGAPATDRYGFSAIASGLADYVFETSSYEYTSESILTSWHSITEDADGINIIRVTLRINLVSTINDYIVLDMHKKISARPVRCVR